MNIINSKTKELFSTFLSTDKKFLNISYPDLECKVEAYNDFLDDMHDHYAIYDTVEDLYLKTDSINSMPINIKKFKKLINLEVSGSRFWDLNVEHVPMTVKKIVLTDHSNLQPECISGIDKLINLECLGLDIDPFELIISYDQQNEYYDENNNIEPLPLMPNLKRIEFDTGMYDEEELLNDWKEIIISHVLFSKIKNCIKNIDYDNFKIIITFR